MTELRGAKKCRVTEGAPRTPRRRNDDAGQPRLEREAAARGPLLIVGIGASAGGLQAFRAFLSAMPADSGMAFVLVQHLAPHHKSMLTDLLSAKTAMPVSEARGGEEVVANRVYVIPPDATLTIAERTLRVVTPAPPREQRRPIDTFFCSLGEDQGENAVCIVLSGLGSDGTIGLKAVKEHGGLTLAQAEFDHEAMSGMPRSAADTGLVDDVMPVEQMPARLVEYQRHLGTVAPRKDGDGTRTDTADHLAAITAIVRNVTGHDFSRYKSNTLVRRIQRRMQVLRIDSAPVFIDLLRTERRQVELLFREFLIGVTHFFRDPAAFAALETTVIPASLAHKRGDNPIRVWVPGCATGEEVYSIAILLKEAMDRQRAAPAVQIFGTDIDDNAVAVARAGRYPRDMVGLSRERTDRWFVEDGGVHCPAKTIRDMCVFSVHDLGRDPPFSRLDLISCRNLMIYLDSDLQSRVARTFHYALRPGGYLFLGPSEGVSSNAKLFAVLDKKHRIFQRRDDSAVALPGFPPAAPKAAALPAEQPSLARPDRLENAVRRIIEKHSPAWVLIDKYHEILRFSGGDARWYLEPSSGTASLNLFALLNKALRQAAKAAVRTAVGENRPIVHEGLTIRVDGNPRAVTLIAEPIVDDAAPGLCIVAFQEVGPATGTGAMPAAGSDAAALHQELLMTKAQLRVANDELESTSEEMRSVVEEYQSVNEELQSSNEELETSKEEMQSINEELQTINAELGAKNEAMTRLNSDLKNLLDSTQIATLFLGPDLRIKSFTPAMMEIFHLREHDVGRPITDIVTRLARADLRRDVKKVLRTLTVVESEVEIAGSDASFIMRVLPYRTVDNVIDGVVVTFVDLSERKRHEAERARMAAIVASSQDAIVGLSLDGTITTWNEAAERIFGVAAAEAVGRPVAMLLPNDRQAEVPALLDRLKRGERIAEFDVARFLKDGATVDLAFTISPIEDRNGLVVGAAVIARDVTERRAGEAALRESEERFAAMFNQARAGVAQLELSGRFALVNPRYCAITSRSAEELSGRRLQEIIHPEDLRSSAELTGRLVAEGKAYEIEKRYVRPDGSAVWVSDSVSAIFDDRGRPRRLLVISLDISERKRAEAQRQLLLHELSHRVKNTLAGVQSIAVQTLRTAPTPDDFGTALIARLRALAGTHDLLTRGEWHGAALRDVLLAEFAPYEINGTSRARVEGEPVGLDPKTALALGMAFHELTMNAVKHGALSVPTGRVEVTWEVRGRGNETPKLHLSWAESGGPAVEGPHRQGFGTRLIQEGLEFELEAEVRLEFDPAGVRCTIDVPLPRSKDEP